jgi:hypothetical protein
VKLIAKDVKKAVLMHSEMLSRQLLQRSEVYQEKYLTQGSNIRAVF